MKSRLSILISIAIFLTEGTSVGEGAANNEVFLKPVKNLKLDALTFLNRVKKEAIPKVKRKETPKRGRRERVKSTKKQKGNGRRKYVKRGNKKHKARGSMGRKNKQTGIGKRKNLKKENKNYKRRGSKGRKNKDKKSGRKINTKAKQRDKKKSKCGKKKRKLHGKRKKPQVDEPRADCSTPAQVLKTISNATISYRKYFNHLKQIKRTDKNLERLIKKSQPSKLEKFTKAADDLKSLTAGGTKCPKDPSKEAKVVELVETLKKCGSSSDSPITKICNKNKIPDQENLDKLAACKTAYPPWKAAFQVCMEAVPQDCNCYLPLNNNIPPVPHTGAKNAPPFSCQKPNNGPNQDWIVNLDKDAKQAFLNCKAEVTACSETIEEALNVASTCSGSPTDSTATTGGSKRRFMQKALLKNRLQHKNNQ